MLVHGRSAAPFDHPLDPSRGDAELGEKAPDQHTCTFATLFLHGTDCPGGKLPATTTATGCRLVRWSWRPGEWRRDTHGACTTLGAGLSGPIAKATCHTGKMLPLSVV